MLGRIGVTLLALAVGGVGGRMLGDALGQREFNQRLAAANVCADPAKVAAKVEDFSRVLRARLVYGETHFLRLENITTISGGRDHLTCHMTAVFSDGSTRGVTLSVTANGGEWSID